MNIYLFLFFYFFIKFLFAINIRSNAVVRTIGPAIAVRTSAVGIISISIWKSIVTSIPVASIPVVSSVKFLDIFGFYTIFLNGVETILFQARFRPQIKQEIMSENLILL